MKKSVNVISFALSFFSVVCLVSSAAGAGVRAAHLYNLSNFTGKVLYDSPRLFVDSDRDEAYVLSSNSVRIFNDSGMEVFRFGVKSPGDRIVDVTIDGRGEMLVLVYNRRQYSIRRCNYRGEPQETVRVAELPADFESFQPNRMVCRGGLLYLADTGSLRVALLDESGAFLNSYDIVPILGLPEEDRADTGIRGFSVDRDGNMLFTIPVLFKAFRLGLNGSLAAFGQPGGTPGKFNFAAGIAKDSRGNYLVVDTIKSVVMVFDAAFTFVTQFGGEEQPEALVSPRDIAIDADDRVYVTQGRKKGISVFRLVYE